MDVRQGIDWSHWLERWDRQQEGYVPDREARFTAMFDALEALLPDRFVALDLGSGPGSLSRRLLARFPRARAIAVDVDPVMLAVGEGAIGTLDGRLRWVDADLAGPDWTAALGETQVDAVLSSTALHWLAQPDLERVYTRLGRLLPPGGVFLDADHITYGPAQPSFRRLDDRARDREWTDEAFARRGLETAEQWWEAIGEEPAVEALLAERTRRFAAKVRPAPVGFDQHLAALRLAGFREIGTIWQVLSDRVLMAVR